MKSNGHAEYAITPPKGFLSANWGELRRFRVLP